MKTIITTLPIYDKLAKQCFERGKHAGGDTPTPIICPRHRLPSFQWLDDTDGAASVSKIEVLGVDNLSADLFDHWVNLSFDSFTSVGLDIINAVQTVGHDTVDLWNGLLSYHQVAGGTVVTISGTFHQISGVAPHMQIYEDGGAAAVDTDFVEGANTFSYTSLAAVPSSVQGQIGISIYGTHGAGTWSFTGVTVVIDELNHYFAAMPVLAHDYFTYNGTTLLSPLTPGLYYLKITMNNALIYYSEWFQVDCVFGNTVNLPPTATYSTKYLIINFHNDCDMGDVYYHGGFTQTIWLVSEPMETSFPIEEEGVKNGEGQFIRTFARQVKKYIVRTKAMPDYMVDVFNRMKLCDSIQLIDLVGDTHDVYNLEVEHEWLDTGKYYAKLDLTFDYNEAVVVAGCCNNIT